MTGRNCLDARIGRASVVALVGICLFAAALAVGGRAQAAETLTFGTNTAPTGLRGEAEQGFIDALEKVSNGEIKVVPYWGSSILKGPEILSGVQNGVVDMGVVNINYYPNQLLLNSAFQLFPEGPADYAAKMKLYDEIYQQVPALNQEFEKQGQRIIYKYAYLPYAGVFRKPVTSFSDFKGRRVRASSRWMLNLLGGLGATPVSVPWSDTYQALQNGAIGGVFTNFDSIHRVGMDEIAPHIIVTRKLWVAVPIVITINEQKWQSLSPQDQGYIKKAAQAAQAKFAAYYKNESDRIIAADKKAGYTVVEASASDVQRFATMPAVAENQKIWEKEARDAGASDPAGIIGRMSKLIKASLNASP